MRYIAKHENCPELAAWKRHNNGSCYADLDYSVRKSIRKSLLKEQYSLCAYCCDRILVEHARNAHILSQDRFPHKSLSWDNMVASCDKPYSCDCQQKNRALPLTPLMPECEQEITFLYSGHIVGHTDRARESIRVLGLDSSKLCAIRRRAIDLLARANGCDPLKDISVLSDEEKLLLIKEINTPDADGKLPAFAPVLASYIRSLIWLSGTAKRALPLTGTSRSRSRCTP